MNKSIAILGVLVVFLGAITLFMLSRDQAPSTVSNTEEVINEDSELQDDSVPVGGVVQPASDDPVGDAPQNGFAKLAENALYVPEQQTTDTVVVTNVNIVPEGYIVVYTVENGKPNEVVGFAELRAGTQARNVGISLTRDMKDGEELIAQLHEDNGDGKFDVITDSPVTDFAENPLRMTFYAMADAADPAAVQVMF